MGSGYRSSIITATVHKYNAFVYSWLFMGEITRWSSILFLQMNKLSIYSTGKIIWDILKIWHFSTERLIKPISLMANRYILIHWYSEH